jgi:hypothetical protein
LIVNHSLNQEIEEFVVSKSCSYLDAIVHIAEKKGIEMESVAKMLNKIIKQSLKLRLVDIIYSKTKLRHYHSNVATRFCSI